MSSLRPEDVAGIEKSPVFVCIVPRGGLEGTLGEEQLRYAMALGKKLVIWLDESRPDDPFPQLLRRPGLEYKVVRNAEQAADLVQDVLGAREGDSINFHGMGYHP